MSRGIARYVRDLRNQIARLEVPESIQQSFGEYRDDPVRFVREVLGTESASRRSDASPYQFEILKDLASHTRVCVRSGHGARSSFFAARTEVSWMTSLNSRRR